MSPKALMLAGAISGVGFSIISALPALYVGDVRVDLTVIMFAAGAVFGKGYGIWEEREDVDA